MTDDPDALMALILNDPDATPEDVKGAADSGAVTQAQARAWWHRSRSKDACARPIVPRRDAGPDEP